MKATTATTAMCRRNCLDQVESRRRRHSSGSTPASTIHHQHHLLLVHLAPSASIGTGAGQRRRRRISRHRLAETARELSPLGIAPAGLLGSCGRPSYRAGVFFFWAVNRRSEMVKRRNGTELRFRGLKTGSLVDGVNPVVCLTRLVAVRPRSLIWRDAEFVSGRNGDPPKTMGEKNGN